MDKSTQTAIYSVWEAKEPYLIVSVFSPFCFPILALPHFSFALMFKIAMQAFAEGINLKEKLKKIGVYPQPKKTKEQVEAEHRVTYRCPVMNY